MPDSITLTNGAILQHVQVVRWEENDVVLKYAGGVDPIQFAYIAEPDKTAVLAVRDWMIGSQNLKPGQTLKGQIFITTRGAGNYKMGDVNVYVFTADLLSRFNSTYVHLAHPVAQTTTDSEGQFSIEIPDDAPAQPFFIYAQAKRMAGGDWEYYDWRVPSSDITNKSNILLTGNNTSSARVVTIDN